MTLAALLVLVAGGVVGALVALALRRVSLEGDDVHRRLLTSDQPTVDYDVPPGVDAADLKVAVSAAGFTGTVLEVSGGQRLRVACDQQDRGRLRDALEHAHSAASGGVPLPLAPVVFVGEPGGQA